MHGVMPLAESDHCLQEHDHCYHHYAIIIIEQEPVQDRDQRGLRGHLFPRSRGMGRTGDR